MLFHSTRGNDSDRKFADIVMQGLASDGGLFMPDAWPQIDIEKFKKSDSFIDIAKQIVPLFTASSYSKEETLQILENTWHDFEDKQFAAIKKVDSKLLILELFHGPTAAFKDFGLQLAAAFFNDILEKEDKTAIILGATSGDTGSAAIDACKKYARIKSFILLPNGNMSEVQRRQMTTVDQPNVFTLRVNGTFDDCQDIVKSAFRDRDFMYDGQYLLAVNSINWVRIIGQICYYFYSYAQLKDEHSKLNFSVPTGNFGNVFACYSALKMGLPLEKIIVAVNENDILYRFFKDNQYARKIVEETISPSMDISIASNFERLIYDFYCERDSKVCNGLFSDFPSSSISLNKDVWQKSKSLFMSARVNDAETLKTMTEVFNDFQYILDPHTAVAFKAAQKLQGSVDGPIIVLATAHPAKFPKTLETVGLTASNIPKSLSHVMDKQEFSFSCEADQTAIINYIKEKNL